MSVMPISAASSTASDDGADTAASTGTPAIAAFWTSSNEARPDTISTVPAAGTRFSSSAQPMALSTALWRPTSSRATRSSPSAVNRPAACRPPVDSNSRCAARSVSGRQARTDGETVTGSSSGGQRVVSRTASKAAFPHTPHEDVV
jgi:hypothetical protein